MTSGIAGAAAPHPHVVQFYERDDYLLDALERFASGGLRTGEPVVVIATDAHQRELEQRLSIRGIDLAAARRTGAFLDLDASETLAHLMPVGEIDEHCFTEVVGGALARVARPRGGRLRAFGEMVAILVARGEPDSAVELERLWTRAARARNATVLCAYPIEAFAGPKGEEALVQICGEHSVVRPAESYARLGTPVQRAQALAHLQRRARALEAEIGHRAASEAALARARDEAQAANLAKDEFLAMLGHELRNPLSAVRNAVVAARLDPARRDLALEIARRGVDQLTRLVDDLLDVARISQGKITLRRQHVSIAAVIQRALEATRKLVEERAHELALTLAGPELYVEGDATRLEQVVANLVSNAAKYTNPGGHIDVRAAADGREVVLRVRDDGIGIAPEMQARVFDLFAQADRALDRSQGGLGIGLTVVRRLVELHGGRVEVHSGGTDKGSEFVVRLPRSDGPRRDADPRLSPREPVCAHVLVVEDNDDAADSLSMLLEQAGHRVTIVADAERALKAIREVLPDLVLADVGLPGMDGYELARCIRADADLAKVPLVALTGYGRSEDRERAIEAGFDRHLVKPVDLAVLEELIARVMRKRP